jgi:hypothetical protein
MTDDAFDVTIPPYPLFSHAFAFVTRIRPRSEVEVTQKWAQCEPKSV